MIWKAKATEIIDHLVYSGAESYDWYRVLDEDGKQVTVAMETGDTDENGEEIVLLQQFTPTELKRIAEEIVKDQRAGWRAVRESIAYDDFDSDSADIVLQHAVLGELVFG